MILKIVFVDWTIELNLMMFVVVVQSLIVDLVCIFLSFGMLVYVIWILYE